MDSLNIIITPNIITSSISNFDNKTSYIYVYSILIQNKSQNTVQLQSRRWFISDEHGKTETIIGDGVVGKTPILQPGGFFEYQSYASIFTKNGCMSGEYYFQNMESGNLFCTEIPILSFGDADFFIKERFN